MPSPGQPRILTSQVPERIETLGVSATQLQYLVTTTETPTWKEAAARLGVSGPALSQGLSELERRLGVSLFETEGRQRTLTAAGVDVARHASRILNEYSELARYVTRVRLGTGGRIALGMIDTAALHHFGDALVTFRSQRPELDVHLVVQPSGTLVDLLDRGELDVIIGVDLPSDDRYVTHVLLREPLFVYAPAGTPPNLPASQWGPWISFPVTSHTRRRVAQHVAAAGATFEVVAESSQPSVLRGMVDLALGWTVLCAADAEHAPHALERFAPEPIAHRTMMLAVRSDRQRSPGVDALIEAFATKSVRV